MILNSLRVQNYKLLKDFRVERLGRLNLIVGRNNSGKSTVLECLRILASKGTASLINEIVRDHDDQLIVQTRGGSEEDSLVVYEGLFTDRAFPEDGSPIYIGSVCKEIYVEINRVFSEVIDEQLRDEEGNIVIAKRRKFYDKPPVDMNSELEPLMRISSSHDPERHFLLSYSEREFERTAVYRRRSPLESESVKLIPISYIPTQFLSMDLLAALWDKAVLTPYFENVRKSLRIISADFEDVAFIETRATSRRSSSKERTGIVKLKDLNKPIPLNSMGDGILRILQLVLGIYPATTGFLLIDEFENGLHFSVQEQIWKLIFELASELDIQVFATTHSWDCIEAFSRAANQSGEDACLIRIGKSVLPHEMGQTIATIFDKQSLENLTQSDVELR